MCWIGACFFGGQSEDGLHGWADVNVVVWRRRAKDEHFVNVVHQLTKPLFTLLQGSTVHYFDHTTSTLP